MKDINKEVTELEAAKNWLNSQIEFDKIVYRYGFDPANLISNEVLHIFRNEVIITWYESLETGEISRLILKNLSKEFNDESIKNVDLKWKLYSCEVLNIQVSETADKGYGKPWLCLNCKSITAEQPEKCSHCHGKTFVKTHPSNMPQPVSSSTSDIKNNHPNAKEVFDTGKSDIRKQFQVLFNNQTVNSNRVYESVKICEQYASQQTAEYKEKCVELAVKISDLESKHLELIEELETTIKRLRNIANDPKNMNIEFANGVDVSADILESLIINDKSK